MGIKKEDFAQAIKRAENDAIQQEAQKQQDRLLQQNQQQQREAEREAQRKNEATQRRNRNEEAYKANLALAESLGLRAGMEALSELTGGGPVREAPVDLDSQEPAPLIYEFAIRSRKGRAWFNTGEKVEKSVYVNGWGMDHVSHEGYWTTVYEDKYDTSPVKDLEDTCQLIINKERALIEIDISRHELKEHKLFKGDIFYSPDRVGKQSSFFRDNPLQHKNPRICFNPLEPLDPGLIKALFVKGHDFLKLEKQSFFETRRK